MKHLLHKTGIFAKKWCETEKSLSGILASASEIYKGDRVAVRRQTVERALKGVLDVLQR